MRILKRTAAVFTAALLIINSAVFSFADSYGTVKITKETYTDISYGNAQYGLHSGTYTKNNKTVNETVHTVTADLGGLYEIQVTSGNTLYGRSTMTSKLNGYNAGKGKRVIAAINGDFFSSTTGLALGLQISDGKVLSTNNYEYEESANRWSVGFKRDGTAVVGRPNITITLSSEQNSLSLDRINAYPDTNLVLLTSDYADKTYWSSNFAHDVAVLESTDSLTLTASADCTFVSYMKGVRDPVTIEKNKLYVICPASDTRIEKMFSGKISGQQISLDITDTAELFNDTVTAFGAGDLLINNGQMRYPSTYDKDISNKLTSRSALGIKPDGSVVFYAVERTNDGTTSGGVWLESVTQALFDMGCVYAVNLDGGGSTTIAAAKDGAPVKVLNSCQDGSERKISNCILLVTSEAPPALIEDFESDLIFDNTSTYPDSLNTTLVVNNVYTGLKSLQLDYTLVGFGHTVSTELRSAIDISNFDRITLTVDGRNNGVMLSAILETNGVRTVKNISRTDFEGYKHLEFETDGADKLRGFELSYQLASRNNGKVVIDRITGYRGFSLSDNTAPNLSVSLDNNKLTATAKDSPFESGTDTNGYYFKIDGVDVTPTFVNGSATADISAVTGNKTVRAVTDGTDIFGNRARKISIFKSNDFTKPLPFADMKEGKWDELYIRYCNENGIIAGMEENGVMMFHGADSITRAQFCTMLVRKAGINVTKYNRVELPYEDLSEIPKWALPYVKAAYAEGIMNGSKTDTGVSFFASNNITRAEAATAVDRIITTDTRLSMLKTYTDLKDIPNWAKPYVESVSAQGIFDGDTDGKFYPKRNLSRSEAAAVMTRI